MTPGARRQTCPCRPARPPQRTAPAAPRAGCGAVGTIALLLAGCSPSADPAQGGFLSGVSGATGGGYAARIEARRDGVTTLSREADRLEADRADRAARIARTREEIAKLEAELAGLRARIGARLDAISRLDDALARRRQAEAAAYLARTEPGPQPDGSPDPDAGGAAAPPAETDESAARIDALAAAVAEGRRIATDLARLSGGG